MVERGAKSGRITVTKRQQERGASKPEEAQFNSRKEEPISTPEGYRFTEEVAGPKADHLEPDNLVAEDAPKARTEGQTLDSIPKLDLSPDSLTLANLCLGSTNAFVVMMFGQECGLFDGEKKLLYPSLARVINRMPAASAGKAAVFVDPIVLLLGLAIWGNRIVSIKGRQRAEANAVTAREFAAASGISWDKQQSAAPQAGTVTDNRNGNIQPPGSTGNGTATVPTEAGPDTANANRSYGPIPGAIADARNDNINGDN